LRTNRVKGPKGKNKLPVGALGGGLLITKVSPVREIKKKAVRGEKKKKSHYPRKGQMGLPRERDLPKYLRRTENEEKEGKELSTREQQAGTVGEQKPGSPRDNQGGPVIHATRAPRGEVKGKKERQSWEKWRPRGGEKYLHGKRKCPTRCVGPPKKNNLKRKRFLEKKKNTTKEKKKPQVFVSP